MPRKKLNPVRRVQKKQLDSAAIASGAASAVFRKIGEELHELDESVIASMGHEYEY